MPAKSQDSKKKSTEAIEELLRKTPGFPVDLDFRFGRFVFSGHGGSNGTLESANFSITVHGVTANHSYPLGAIRFNPEKWAEFKKLGDGLLKGLSTTIKLKKKKK